MQFFLFVQDEGEGSDLLTQRDGHDLLAHTGVCLLYAFRGFTHRVDDGVAYRDNTVRVGVRVCMLPVVRQSASQ